MKKITLKNILSAVTAGILAVTLSSCFYAEIERNQKNLAKIRKGMTRKQVLEIMGEPVKGEAFCTDHELFYYTRQSWMDGMIMRDECTPIVFDEFDRVIGWGYDYHSGILDRKQYKGK
ncbi:MAG: DUF3192 domain-containing protein [Lentisphaeria bacterium]|nr:DUF3192 domain-containing protein [Lentisphaeria bacterium]